MAGAAPARYARRMASYTGTVKKNDLEGGFWELHADDGERYQLQSDDQQLLVEGLRVKIDGTIDKGGFGIGMTGPYLQVSAWRQA